MEPRLDRAQFWILSSLATFTLPLNLIGLPDVGETPSCTTMWTALNRCGPGVPIAALARTIASMLRRGWVEITSAGSEPVAASPVMTAAQIERELVRRGAFAEGPCLALTAAGGAAWEQFARPRWACFVDDVGMSQDDPPGALQREVIALDDSFLERYLRAVRATEDVVPGSESRDVLHDWQPTYWKPAGRGHRCKFMTRAPNPSRIAAPGDDPMWLRTLWHEWR